MSGFDDKYIYGFGGKNYSTPDRATEPDEDKEYEGLEFKTLLNKYKQIKR